MWSTLNLSSISQILVVFSNNLAPVRPWGLLQTPFPFLAGGLLWRCQARDPLPKTLIIHTAKFPSQIVHSLAHPCLAPLGTYPPLPCHRGTGIVSGVPSVSQSYTLILFLRYCCPCVGNGVAFRAPKGCRERAPLHPVFPLTYLSSLLDPPRERRLWHTSSASITSLPSFFPQSLLIGSTFLLVWFPIRHRFLQSFPGPTLWLFLKDEWNKERLA